jgi:hypothetical protein
MNTSQEIAALLARVIYRLLTRQNLAPPRQDCLDVPPKTLLSVTKPVNSTGHHGETR